MFSTEIFMARGHSYLWTPWLVWTQVISNTVIALALMVVGGGMLRLRRREGERTGPGPVLLAGFALLLGAAHLLDVWVVWHPAYGLDAIVRSAGALAGVAAAVVAVRARG